MQVSADRGVFSVGSCSSSGGGGSSSSSSSSSSGCGGSSSSSGGGGGSSSSSSSYSTTKIVNYCLIDQGIDIAGVFISIYPTAIINYCYNIQFSFLSRYWD